MDMVTVVKAIMVTVIVVVKRKKRKKSGDHGHSHSGGSDHGRSHGGSQGDDHGHSHGEMKKKADSNGDSHGHSHGGSQSDHGHSHGEKRRISKNEMQSPDEISEVNLPILNLDEEGIVDGDFDDHEVHKVYKMDMNFYAIFLHYLGDALSSVMVLVAGLLTHFFPGEEWTKYLDPVASLLIVVLILWTTIPLVQACSSILLQQVSAEISVPHLKSELSSIRGVLSVHDLHVWQLVDNLHIASLHLTLIEGDTKFSEKIAKAKEILHSYGIHSSTIQPEFMHNSKLDLGCEQNCVKDCDEDWCCKDDTTKKGGAYDTFVTSNV